MTSVPKYVMSALNTASGVSKCWVNNSKAQDWLFDNLGLNTDDNSHKVRGFDVDFCWMSQKWFVA